MAAKIFAAKYFRNMHFNYGQLAQQQGVHYGNRSVRVTAGVYYYTGARAARLLDPLYKFALVVALAKIDDEVIRFGAERAHLSDVIECVMTIERRLANSEHI